MNVAGKRVLVFGDSLTHRGARADPDGVDVTEGPDRRSTPGDLLASHLLVAGARAARINGRVSRSAWNLFHGGIEDGAAVLAAERARAPDVSFVFLGTNDGGLDPAHDAAAFATIRAALPGEVWAIGPPYFASASAAAGAATVYQTLAQVFGPGRVIDLRPLSSDVGRTSDGIHFTAAGSRTVAARLAQAVAAAGGAAPRSGLETALVVASIATTALAAGFFVWHWHRTRAPRAPATGARSRR